MMEPTTEIAAYNTQLEADLVVAVLAEAGIDSFIVADNLGGTFPMMQMITGGYKVRVLEVVAEEAREMVATDGGEDRPAPDPVPRRSAIFRFLARLTPAQIFGVLALLATSIATTLYAVTQGTL